MAKEKMRYFRRRRRFLSFFCVASVIILLGNPALTLWGGWGGVGQRPFFSQQPFPSREAGPPPSPGVVTKGPGYLTSTFTPSFHRRHGPPWLALNGGSGSGPRPLWRLYAPSGAPRLLDPKDSTRILSNPFNITEIGIPIISSRKPGDLFPRKMFHIIISYSLVPCYIINGLERFLQASVC